MHRCVHCGVTRNRRSHLARHYARRHPIATALAWLILGVPALAILVTVGAIYALCWIAAFILTGGKIGDSHAHRY